MDLHVVSSHLLYQPCSVSPASSRQVQGGHVSIFWGVLGLHSHPCFSVSWCDTWRNRPSGPCSVFPEMFKHFLNIPSRNLLLPLQSANCFSPGSWLNFLASLIGTFAETSVLILITSEELRLFLEATRHVTSVSGKCRLGKGPEASPVP